MKSLASESIRNTCFNLEWLSGSSRLAQLGISTLDIDAEFFMYRVKCKSYYNVFSKEFDQNEYFSPFEFSLP